MTTTVVRGYRVENISGPYARPELGEGDFLVAAMEVCDETNVVLSYLVLHRGVLYACSLR